MDEKLTSQISKLGHEIEEIRVRALSTIISKLDLGIVNDRELINYSDIFVKLIDWFDFASVPCKKDVLQLIIRLTKDQDGAFYLRVADPGLTRLEKSIGAEFAEEISLIRRQLEDSERYFANRPSPLSIGPGLESVDSSLVPSLSTNKSYSVITPDWEYREVYWWVPKLDESDSRVLRTVAQSLSSGDRSQVGQVASFFSSVLVHDFPPQVFLHDTSILDALFKLYREDNENEAVLACFKEFSLSLQRQIKLYEDPASIETVCYVSRDGDDMALCEWTEAHSPTEHLGVGEFSALCLEKLGHRLPSVLGLLRQVIRGTESFWLSTSGAFLKSCISNHLNSLGARLKAARCSDPLGRLELQLWLSTVLSCLVPESIASTVLHESIQSLLYEELFDPILALGYPDVHLLFKKYVDQFQYLDSSDLGLTERCGESLRAAGRLHSEAVGQTSAAAAQLLPLLYLALQSFDIHRDSSLVQLFFKTVSQSDLEKSEMELSEEILLCLLAHSELHLQEITYEALTSMLAQYLGPQAALSCPSRLSVFPRLLSLLSPAVLKEIISFGLNSSSLKIRASSETTLSLLVKARQLVSEEEWLELLGTLTACFPLLQTLASTPSSLARHILQLFDPDLATSLSFHKLQVLIGNVRFLFSSSEEVASEGYSRLLYLLGITPQFIFSMPEPPLVPPSQQQISAFTEDGIPRLMEVLRSGEGGMLRSAVVQVALLSDQSSLHVPLLDAGVLPLLRDIMHAALEVSTEESRDLFSSSVVVLKNLALHNIQIRNDFSVDYSLYCDILKGLFTLTPERCLVRDAVQLLALMAFSDCFVASEGCLSVPKLLRDHLRLPFHLSTHHLISTHTLPSYKGVLMSRKEIRLYLGGVWWYSVGGDLENPAGPLPVPLELPPLKQRACLRLLHLLQVALIDLKTASSHQTASSALANISRYVGLLKRRRKQAEEKEGGGVEQLAWEESFRRYLVIVPASPADQILLTSLLRLLRQLLCSFPGQAGWVSSYLSDPTKMLCTLLTQTTIEDCTSVHKELSLSVLALTEICLRLRKEEDWLALATVLLQSLHQSHTQKFYTLAVLEGLLGCLTEVCERLWSPGSARPLWKLLAAFHCPSSSSFMGLSVTRRALFSLNSILAASKEEAQPREETGWLRKVLASRDWLTLSAALELLCRLSTTSKSLSLLLHYLPDLWDIALRLLLDGCRSCLVREQAAILCFNIVTNSNNKVHIVDIVEKGAFESFTNIYVRHKTRKKSDDIFFYHSTSYKDDSDEFYQSGVSSKRLVALSCNLAAALLQRDPPTLLPIAGKSGFLPALAGDLSEWRCEKIQDQETVELLESVLRLLVISFPSASAWIPKEAPQFLIWLLCPSSYGGVLERDGLQVEALRLLALSRPAEGSLVLPEELVPVLRSALVSTSSSSGTPQSQLSSAAAAAIPALANSLSQKACLELVEVMLKEDDCRSGLASIVGCSQSASHLALELGLLSDSLVRLTRLQLELALAPRGTKKCLAALERTGVELMLLTNLLAGCGRAKEAAAHSGLADYLHKIWVWALGEPQGLLSPLLRALVTFTASSVQAAGSLTLTSTLAGVGQRRTPSSLSLLHAVLALLAAQPLASPQQIRLLLLELLSHASQAVECRNIIAKSSVLSEFLATYSQKKSPAVDEMESAWLSFLLVFSSFSEGQAALAKNEEMEEALLDYLGGGRGAKHRVTALAIFRNITFNQTFKRRLLLTADKVINSVGERLCDLNLSDDEMLDILVIAWSLGANSQRGKSALRNSGLTSRLETALRLKSRPHQLLEISQIVLPIVNS